MGDRLKAKVVRPLRRGQLTIPQEFREELGITEDTLLLVALKGRKLEITPVDVRDRAGSAGWLKALYDLYAPVREDLATKYTSEEIDRAIDEAIEGVRSDHA